jgi:CO/xanthine dehydrogenase Mo-binding subunit
MTIEEALAPGAPLLFDGPSPGVPVPVGEGATSVKDPRPNVLYEFGYTNGDADAVLAASDHVFEDRFAFSRINHFHLEPHVNVARVTGDQIELWSCNQDPFVTRTDIARVFAVPASTVRVHASYVGGGFGGKSYCKMEPLAVLLAMKAGRPVRLCLSMDESLLTLTKHAGILILKTGVTKDGILTARKSEIQLDGGAYSDASAMTALKAGYRITGPYRWRAVATRAYAVRTTSVPAGSFRGFGGTQASFASESQIDMIARRLGLDPYEFRRRNLLMVGEPFQPNDSGMDSDLMAGLDTVAARLGYHGRVRHPTTTVARGMGMSIGLKDGGGTGNHAQALVKLLASGRVIVHTATVEIGQGATTALSRIAANALGLPLERVRYGAIDTDHTPLNNGTHVSCATTVTGTAVERAALDAKRQVLELAADQLGCKPEDLTLESGWTVRRGNFSHPLEPLITSYYGGAGFEFIGRGHMKVPFDPRAPLRAVNLFWIPSWAGAEVEVDRETGRVRVLKLVVGADTGRAINADACRGQIEGAALQAYGQSLFEQVCYDGAQPANATPLRYRVPLAGDLPERYESFIAEEGRGPGPLGAKGIGESGMLGVASAIANAIEDAVGVRLTALPFTPERVLAAIDAQRN